MAQEDADADQVGDACEPSLVIVPEPGLGPMLWGGGLLLAAGSVARRRKTGVASVGR